MYEFHYSTKNFGDMRSSKNREEFLNYHKLDSKPLIIPEQVHGNNVVVVSKEEAGSLIMGADGLVTGDDTLVLGVLAADCVPLLFVDPKKRMFGVVHAGWRGTLGGIVKNIIDKMKVLGAHPKDILVSIGPHIGMCCYDVPQERVQHFFDMFGNDSKVASFIEGKWYLDVGYANFLSLVDQGIFSKNIHSPIVCTSCQIDTYFSYHKNKKSFGEMMGVIAWKI